VRPQVSRAISRVDKRIQKRESGMPFQADYPGILSLVGPALEECQRSWEQNLRQGTLSFGLYNNSLSRLARTKMVGAEVLASDVA